MVRHSFCDLHAEILCRQCASPLKFSRICVIYSAVGYEKYTPSKQVPTIIPLNFVRPVHSRIWVWMQTTLSWFSTAYPNKYRDNASYENFLVVCHFFIILSFDSTKLEKPTTLFNGILISK